MGKVTAEVWTLDKFITRVQRDLDLESETFYDVPLLTDAVNSAITDIEQLVVDEYSDYLLTYKDYDMVSGQGLVELPDDVYMMRVRWIHFRNDGFNNNSNLATDAYKIRKMPMEDVQNFNNRDEYRYRILNPNDAVPRLELFPVWRGEDQGTARLRVWYIRTFKRLFELSDVSDVPIPEYILAHMRVAVMAKEGNPMIDLELRNRDEQRLKLQKTLKFLSDDEEDTKLLPNLDSLEDYGDNTWIGAVGR